RNKKGNIIFYANSENQLISIKPIYESLLNTSSLNPVFYSIETYLTFRNLKKILKYIIWSKNCVKTHIKGISEDLQYASINLENVLKVFYSKMFIINIIKLFNVLNNFIDFIDRINPKLVIITNDFLPGMRMVANYLKLEQIPTLYIPHAAIPIIEEMVTMNDIKYFALGGPFDKDYYIKKGIDGRNISITGVPRYEYFYKKKLTKLSEFRDMVDGRIYKLGENKMTILLTTNPIDDISNEKIITTVAKSLKDLKLENNFIIKLHPRENGLIHRRICKNLGINPIIIKDYQILDVINSCNILVSQKSTTILESMIVGTPIIGLDLVNKNFRETSKYLFLDEKYINIAYDQDSLTDLIRELITNKSKINKYIQILKENAKMFVFYDKNNPPIKKIVALIRNLD
ncbi:MAG: hypothetical protein ACXACX_13960, partial [Candidatus Hodarchaeales archaeon]